MSSGKARAEALAPWVVGLLLATPVLIAYYPPMTDLPYHEAAVSILRNFSDTAMFPPGLYRINLGQPNQLFHMAAWPLAYAFGSRWAVKLVVAATVFALPVSAARFARHVGSSRLAALLVAPMALGWLFSWGLIANLLGFTALLAMFPVLDQFEEEPTRRGALKTLGALVLLYFAHETAMFLFSGAALLFAALHPPSWKKTLARVSPFVVGVAITVLQDAWQKPLMSPSVTGVRTIWHTLPHKLRRIPEIIFPASDALVNLSMLALCLLAVGSFLWLRARERRAEAPAATGAEGRLHRLQAWGRRYRWEGFALACFVGYFVFPFSLNGATLIYHRWFPPAYAAFVVVAAPRDLWIAPARIARFIAFVFPAATLLATWPSFADSDRAYQKLDELLPLIERGSAVAELELGPGDPTRTFSTGHADGRVLATRGGRLGFAFTDSPVSPVIIPLPLRWDESLYRLGRDSWAFRPAHDFRSFRYALVRSSDPQAAVIARLVLAPEGRLVARAGEWALYESTLEVIPPTSPALPMPTPLPEALRVRGARLLQENIAPATETPAAREPSPPAVPEPQN